MNRVYFCRQQDDGSETWDGDPLAYFSDLARARQFADAFLAANPHYDGIEIVSVAVDAEDGPNLQLHGGVERITE
jgi:hypothetical protein